MLRGRFKSPALAVQTVSKWTSLPLSIDDLLPADARSMSRVVDWNAPLDVAVALDPRGEGRLPQPLAVVSIGLRSLDEATAAARAAGTTLQRVRAGVFRAGVAEPANCAIAASVGAAPARLVCGDRWKDVEELLGYATRGLPAQSLGDADVVAELSFEPIHRRYSRLLAASRLSLGLALRQIQIDNPRFDRALADAAYALADELVALSGDLDKVRVDATLDTKKEELVVSASLHCKGDTSWIVQTLRGIEAGPAPSELYRIPESSSGGGFDFGPKPERLAPFAKTLGDLVEGYLEHRKLPRASRERWRRVIERFFALRSSTVNGWGELPPLEPKDPLAKNALANLGWTVIFTRDRTPDVTALLESLVAALDDPALRKLAKEKLEIADELWPKFKKRPIRAPGFKGQGLSIEVSIDSGALRRGDLFDDVLDPELPTARLAVVVLPDPAGTWIGYGPDEKRVLAKLAEIGPEGGERHARLRRLSQVKAISANFGTLGGLLASYRSLAKGRDLGGLLRALPNRGAEPMFGVATVQTAGASTTTTLTVEVPKAVVADGVALVPLLIPEGLLALGRGGELLKTP